MLRPRHQCISYAAALATAGNSQQPAATYTVAARSLLHNLPPLQLHAGMPTRTCSACCTTSPAAAACSCCTHARMPTTPAAPHHSRPARGPLGGSTPHPDLGTALQRRSMHTHRLAAATWSTRCASGGHTLQSCMVSPLTSTAGGNRHTAASCTASSASPTSNGMHDEVSYRVCPLDHAVQLLKHVKILGVILQARSGRRLCCEGQRCSRARCSSCGGQRCSARVPCAAGSAPCRLCRSKAWELVQQKQRTQVPMCSPC